LQHRGKIDRAVFDPPSGLSSALSVNDKSIAFVFCAGHDLRALKDFLGKILDLTRPYRFRLVLGIFFGILAGLLEPLMVGTVAFVYHVIFETGNGAATTQTMFNGAPKWAQPFLEHLIKTSQETVGQHAQFSWLLLALIPIVFFLRGVTSYVNVYFLHWVAVRSIADLRARLFAHLLSLPASFFAQTRSAELMSRLLADTESLRATLSSSIASLVKDPITLISLFAYLFWQQPKLTAISLLVLPICIIPISIYGRKGRKAATTLQKQLANLTHSMMESFTGNRIVKAYNLEPAVSREFRETATRLTSSYMRLVRSLEVPGTLLEIAGSVGVVIVLGYMLTRPDARPDGSSFLGLVGAIIAMYRPMKTLTRLHASMEQARAASSRVFELLATKSSMPEPVKPKPLNAAGADIRFENVSFAYGEKNVLAGINLTVNAGKIVALVGSSGSGKTTLTNLLLRFYDPTQGAITIGGIDLREVATRDLRNQIAIVTQETILFNDTIRNNIALGRPGASEEEIVAAAKHAHAHEFIVEKPEGYNTPIGERGVALSGGQRQRIAIARAILKDAPILVLDEATSSLDTQSERAVQAALEELMVGRTTICIAHRLSTIQKADLIVALLEGKIAETGTHTDLLSRNGVYANLHKMQFSAP
jgi:subfamily B ATP-binding cassette protein MsbA